MANESILTPGCDLQDTSPKVEIDTSDFLQKSKYLNEFESDSDKSVVRENLDIYPKSEVYTKNETNIQIANAVSTAVNTYLELDDPHKILPRVEEKIKGMVKTDGSTPFTSPLEGVKPLSDNHLTTKGFVKQLIREHTDLIGLDDPHEIIPVVLNILTKYVLANDIYSKTELYTKKELDKELNGYIKKDGTTAFTKAQIGVDPTISSHLATKRYVDSVLYEHLVSIDPHGFISILDSKLSSYAKKSNVYDKSETYSKALMEDYLSTKLASVIESALDDYLHNLETKIDLIKKANYVKADGSIAFTNPLVGVEATQDNELTTLKLVTELIGELTYFWTPSGPVESTVGHVEDNTEFLEPQSFLLLMDSIFYGRSVSVSGPDYVNIGEKCEIIVCIHGSLGTIESAELYLGDDLIYSWDSSLIPEVFKDGCVTVESNAIEEDTKFTFKVYYREGSHYEAETTVKCSLQIFVGLLPYFEFGNTVSYDELLRMHNQDIEGTLNRFLDGLGSDIDKITFKYKFQDPKLRHPFIVVPASYPDLEFMSTPTQKFGLEAFDIINMIPLDVPNSDKDIIYKMYVYKLALSSLDEYVTFNFKKA